MEIIKGRFNECSWSHFREQGNYVLLEFSIEAVNITIISGFQLEDSLLRFVR